MAGSIEARRQRGKAAKEAEETKDQLRVESSELRARISRQLGVESSELRADNISRALNSRL